MIAKFGFGRSDGQLMASTPVRLVAMLIVAAAAAVACSNGSVEDSGAANAPSDALALPAEATATARPETSPSSGGSGFEPAPVVDFVWFDGTAGSTADLVGQPTVLNFWASNCPPCLAEMPALEEVHQALIGSVTFVGIDVADDRDEARELAERTGVTYRLADDPDSAVFRSFGGFVLPTTVFMNADGEVAYVWAGVLTGDELRILIDAHILPGSL